MSVVLYWFTGQRKRYALRMRCSIKNLAVFGDGDHAGSFYWIAKRLPLDIPHTLVLFDAHDDATQHLYSDRLRESIRKSKRSGSIDSLSNEWRSRGLIQCYDWIEPLMPAAGTGTLDTSP